MQEFNWLPALDTKDYLQFAYIVKVSDSNYKFNWYFSQVSYVSQYLQPALRPILSSGYISQNVVPLQYNYFFSISHFHKHIFASSGMYSDIVFLLHVYNSLN